NKFQLSGIGIDIADSEYAELRRLEFCRIHRNEVFMQVDTPLRDRPEFHRQAKEGKHGVARNVVGALVALDGCRRKNAIVALEAGDLSEPELHFSDADQLAHLPDAVRRCAEIVAPMQERKALGQRLEI